LKRILAVVDSGRETAIRGLEKSALAQANVNDPQSNSLYSSSLLSYSRKRLLDGRLSIVIEGVSASRHDEVSLPCKPGTKTMLPAILVDMIGVGDRR